MAYMSRRIYGILDSDRIGPDLELTNAAQIVTFIGTPTDNHRMVPSDIPLSVDPGDVEFLIYGPEALTAGKVRLGVVRATADSSKYVGEDGDGYGYDPVTGKVTNGGADIATIGTAGKDQVLRMSYDPAGIVSFTGPGGAVIGSFPVPLVGSPGDPDEWFFAVTVSGATAGELLVWCNAGQQGFQTTITSGGWWVPIPSIAPVTLGTAPYMAGDADPIPGQYFDGVDGCIDEADGVRISRGVIPWTQGSGTATDPGQVTIRVRAPAGAYQELLGDVRDLPVRILSVRVGGTLADASPVASAVIDEVHADGDFSLVITLQGVMSLLEAAFTDQLFLPNAQEQAAGTPMPSLLGGARQISPVLFDDTNNLYMVTDPYGAMLAVGVQRVAGRQIVAGTDYNVTTDGRSFQLFDSGEDPPMIPDGKPNGIFTAEASVAGGEFDPGEPDYLETDGQWLSDSGTGTPDHWTAHSERADTLLPYWVSAHHVRFPSEYLTVSWLRWDRHKILAGRSYAYRFHVRHMPGTSATGGGVYGDGKPVLQLTYIDAVADRGLAFSLGWGKVGTYRGFTEAGTYTGHFTNTVGIDVDMYVAYYGTAQLGVYAEIGDLELTLLPAVDTNLALDMWTLEQYCRSCIETHGKLDPSVWRAIDAAAIDAARPWKIGNWIRDAATIKGVLNPALDSFFCAMYQRRDGTIGVMMFVNPDDVADADLDFELTQDDFTSQMQVSQDRAPGLSTQAMCIRNFTPIAEGQFAQYDTTEADGVPISVRKKLGREYQRTVYSGVQLANMYRHAKIAKPVPTLFDSVADAQAFIDLVNRLYRVPRYFYRVTAIFPPDSTLEIGQVGRLTYPFHEMGFTNPDDPLGPLIGGEKVQIHWIDESPSLETAIITFWG